MSEQSTKQLYDTRLKRFNDAVSLKKPDRVPCVSYAAFFVTRYAGMTDAEALYDYERLAAAWKESTLKLGFDLAPSPRALLPGSAMEIIGAKQYKWPGYNLPADTSFQFVESEYLLASEYDEFLRDPGDFTLRKLWPRITTALEPMAVIPPLHWMSGGSSFFYLSAAMFGNPAVAGALRTMMEFAEEIQRRTAIMARLTKELEDLGFPMTFGPVAMAPFDVVSDNLRGLRGSLMDMYRYPDKLLAVIDLYTEMQIQQAISQARVTGNPRIFIPLHRGAGGFMSNEQFAKFYWPSLKKLMLALIDARLTPMPWWEGDYTPRLEYLAELPPGKVASHFDIVDLKKCKEIVGDVMCFWGNLPAALLITGTTAQVTDYVRLLIETFADNGGLIVDGAVSGVPDESKPENVEAMIAAVHKYGVH